MQTETINVLWTGGLDSTFRICQLSFEHVKVQPYYILEERLSTAHELRAIEQISARLRARKSSRFELLPVILIDRDSLQPQPAVDHALEQLNRKYGLGSQYEYISRCASQLGLRLELGLESCPRGRATTSLTAEGSLNIANYSTLTYSKLPPPTTHTAHPRYATQVCSDRQVAQNGDLKQPINTTDYLKRLDTNALSALDYFILDKEHSSSALLSIFENINIPAQLFCITKVQEVEKLKEWDMEEIMKLTWFCHRPVLGYPCGRCGPCKDALNEGLSWRVPIIGRVLGFVRFVVNLPIRAVNKIKRTLFK